MYCSSVCVALSRTTFTMIDKQLWYLSNILKTMISPKTIMFLRLLGGHYYKISSSRVVCAAAAIYCIIFNYYEAKYYTGALALSIPSISIQTVSAVSIHLSNVLTSLCYPQYFQVYLTDMAAVDISLRGKSDLDIPCTRVLFLAFLTSQVSIAIPYIVTGLSEEHGYFQITTFLFVGFCVLQNAVIYLIAIMVFEILWYRVRKFREYVEERLPQLCRACRAQDTQVATDDIYRCMLLYQTILEALKKTNVPIKTLILMATVTSFCKVLASVFDQFSYSNSGVILLRIHEAVSDCVLPLMPAVLAALIQGELRRIKLFIGNLILNTHEDIVREALCDCQLYLEHRSFRYSVCRLYNVDMNLIVTVINVYVTSVIALIQFCHFFN